MTTTDLWINDEDGKSVVIYSGGLGGFAFGGFDRLRDLAKAGEATGTYDISSADLTVTGAALMPVLRSLEGGYRVVDRKREPVTVETLESVIDPAKSYRASYVEF